MVRNFRHSLPVFLLLCFFFICFLLIGCGKSDSLPKTNALDYTIVSGSDIPDELQELIKERCKNAFELTFSDHSCLYVVKGYGKQTSGGYSIVVHDFYQSDQELVFDTELFGPKKDTSVSSSPSYPYIVIKTEYRENPVVFQ